jgi:prephenate dehydrogenase
MTIDDCTVAVLGLGLVGGSIARDLAARGVRVAGFDADPATLDAACVAGVVQTRLDADLHDRGAGETDSRTIVIIAVPVSETRRVIQGLPKRLAQAALVMDVASTKRSVLTVAAAAGIAERFVGSHPMAGDHRTGWSASRRGLFSGATVYLCPTPRTHDDAIQIAREFWGALGGRTQLLDDRDHDERVAFTSHMPHVVSAALALAMAKAGIGHDELGPGGRDVLRLARSSPDMWSAVAADNSEAILKALAAIETELAAFRHTLTSGDERALHAMFSAARAWTDDGNTAVHR